MPIQIQKAQQQTPMARKLLSIAAPVAGGMMGGPVGAALGGLLGGKLGGQTTQDALISGLKSGTDYKSTIKDPNPSTTAGGEVVGQGAGGAMSRMLDARSQDPQVAIHEGLNYLSTLAPDDPLKQQLAPNLIRASMMNPRTR